jgi:hypothetical protein
LTYLFQACRELYLFYGETKWKDLTPEERFEMERPVWCGCCMHKEMNSVKGGVQAMDELWGGSTQ